MNGFSFTRLQHFERAEMFEFSNNIRNYFSKIMITSLTYICLLKHILSSNYIYMDC